jgi:D-alanyl-D-alanine carboxypeptidase (penicillin-binding protein 5/6)
VKRYRYTPRRSGPPPGSASNSLLPLAIPAALIVGLIAIFVLLAGGKGGDADCSESGCEALTVADAAVDGSTTATARPLAAERSDAPEIDGEAAYVMEALCGAPLYELNGRKHYPPASLTKMMTALAALENSSLDEMVESPIDGALYSFQTDSTVMGLDLGEQLTMEDMLYGMLLTSGSDAAIAIADHVSGGDEDAFVAMMNAKADEMGLENTHFANPHGLDDSLLYSSAEDIAVIAQALLEEPTLAGIVGTVQYTPDWGKGPIENKNLFLTNYPGAIGVKTGYTDDAGQTIAAAATRNGRTLIVSVLHSEEMFVDAGALLDWAFAETAPACAG